MQVKFNRPVTLTAEDGEQATFGKGVHNVDAKFASGWYFDALKKGDDILVLKEDEVVESADILVGNVKEVVAAVEAAEMADEELAALAEREAAGKNRKGVLDAIEAKKAK